MTINQCMQYLLISLKRFIMLLVGILLALGLPDTIIRWMCAFRTCKCLRVQVGEVLSEWLDGCQYAPGVLIWHLLFWLMIYQQPVWNSLTTRTCERQNCHSGLFSVIPAHLSVPASRCSRFLHTRSLLCSFSPHFHPALLTVTLH